MTPIKLEVSQGSNEWFNERQRRIGASESPIILLKQLMWGTPYSLYSDKIKPIGEGKRDSADNWATRRGKFFEPKVRARYELFSDLDFPEGSFYNSDHPHIMASLDGVNFQTKKILEIKVPSREVYELAANGIVHEKYVYQLEQQIFVMGGDDTEWSVDFVCGKIEKVNGRDELVDHVTVAYQSIPERRKELLDAVNHFWFECVLKQEPPPFCEEDTMDITKTADKVIFTNLQDALLALDKLEDEYKTAKSKVDGLKKEVASYVDSHPRVRWNNIELIKRSRKGNVDYSKLSADTGVDVEKYRGQESSWIEVKLVG